MKTNKAYIKLDGTIGEKEQSSVEYIDKEYINNMKKQEEDLKKLLSNKKDDTSSRQ